jgi:hypothetical protein
MEFSNGNFKDIYMTRGVYLNPDNLEREKILKAYLAQEIDGESVTLVDGGCMGTASHTIRAYGYKVQNLFLFSLNPGIESFLTSDKVVKTIKRIMPRCSHIKFSHILLKMFERAIPKLYQSPKKLIQDENGLIKPLLVKSDPMSQILHNAMKEVFGKAHSKSLEEVLFFLSKEFVEAKQGKDTILMPFYNLPYTNKLLWR